MKIPYLYLKNFLNTQYSKKKLMEVFTKVGFECEIHNQIIEFDVTPNRGDILSLRGLQREFYAFQSKTISESLKTSKIKIKSDKSVINKIDKRGCLNYHLLIIKGINKLKKLDKKKSKFLLDAGVPLINPLVDLGNYIMLEIGAPMHVFDLDKLSLPINIVFPKSNNLSLKVIGGDLKNIKKSSLIVEDQLGVQAIAGIIGGHETSVSKKTKNIAIEAAFFKPDIIVNQARKYGLATDASHRFERGVDPKIQKLALERYLYILREIANFDNVDCFVSGNSANKIRPVTLCIQKFNSFSGLNLKSREIKKILKHLEFKLVSENTKNIKFTVPSHRFDIEHEEDLYEELLRCYGYENIPISPPKSGPKKDSNSNNLVQKLRTGLVYAGFTELMHIPFVSRETYSSLVDVKYVPVEIINPINENEQFMRGSLFGDLFSAVNLNLKKGHPSIKIFEIGNVFVKAKNTFSQNMHLTGLIYNSELIKSWGSKEFIYDFYSLKTEVIKLLKTLEINNLKFQKARVSKVFSKNALDIFQGKIKIGVMGEINLSASQKMLKKPCYGFELYPEKISEDILGMKIIQLSKFPSSTRDINMIINKSYNYGELEAKLSQIINKIQYIKTFELINVFEGKGIPAGFISITIRFIFQSNSKSLQDHEISSGIRHVSIALKESFNIKIRS